MDAVARGYAALPMRLPTTTAKNSSVLMSALLNSYGRVVNGRAYTGMDWPFDACQSAFVG